MKTNILVSLLLLMTCSAGYAQTTNPAKYAARTLTVEPAIGIHSNFGTDLLLSTLVQWTPQPRLSFAAHSSYNINNSTQREFNNITTNYNYSFNQKFGVGSTLYAKRSSHSFFLMAGAKYTAYKETLHNPDFASVSSAISTWSPDYGMMYALKKGWKKYFFSFRMYIPLYPWPLKGSDINYSDSNMSNVALEFGVGIKLK